MVSLRERRTVTSVERRGKFLEYYLTDGLHLLGNFSTGASQVLTQQVLDLFPGAHEASRYDNYHPVIIIILVTPDSDIGYKNEAADRFWGTNGIYKVIKLYKGYNREFIEGGMWRLGENANEKVVLINCNTRPPTLKELKAAIKSLPFNDSIPPLTSST